MPKSIILQKAIMLVLTFACTFIMPSFTPLNSKAIENSQFLLSVDNDARIFIDTKEEGIVTKNEFKIFKVFPGEHIIEARSLDGTGKYRQIHRVEEGHQEIIEIKLLPSDESIGLVGKFIDPRDNQEYRTVKINGKTWLAENLKYNTLRSWCNANDNNNCIKFGRLYHFDYAKSAIPKGWHLPTRKEWEDLLALYTSETIIKI